MRAGDKEARHAQTVQKAVGKPDEADVAIALFALAIANAQHEEAESGDDESRAREVAVESGIQQATDDARQGEHHEALGSAEEVEEESILVGE